MRSPPRPVDWVVFDLGETLVDETANWGRWADHLGVPRLTFFAVMGAVIADGRPHTEAFEHFRPGFSLEHERLRKATPWHVGPEDLYPDALPTLRRLRSEGYLLAIMANQPAEVSPFLATLPVDLHATSAQWGLSKPDPRFFRRLLATVGAEPDRVAYVGDRVDNDVVPAAAAGMVAVHPRRGPWGFLHSTWAAADAAALQIDDLGSLSDALASLGPRRARPRVRPGRTSRGTA